MCVPSFQRGKVGPDTYHPVTYPDRVLSPQPRPLLASNVALGMFVNLWASISTSIKWG